MSIYSLQYDNHVVSCNCCIAQSIPISFILFSPILIIFSLFFFWSQAARHNYLLENNIATLGKQLSSILAEYKGKVRDNLAVLTAESDLVSSLFFLLGENGDDCYCSYRLNSSDYHWFYFYFLHLHDTDHSHYCCSVLIIFVQSLLLLSSLVPSLLQSFNWLNSWSIYE